MAQFDKAFQEQLAAHYLRDDIFVQSVGSLVLPDYFENETLAALVAVQSEYLSRYSVCCELRTFVQVVQRMASKKQIKIADKIELKRLLTQIWKDPLHDRQYVIDVIADFARKQALSNSMLVLADALDADDVPKIDKALVLVDDAKQVGAADAAQAMDFKRSLKDRLAYRQQRALGSYTNGGISTGIPELDSQLTPHRGWGRKEITILMGPPKSGKTQALKTFAKNAAEAGHKVLYVSCEVDEHILSMRLDSEISGIPIKELDAREAEVETAVETWAANIPGELLIQSFPIRTLKVSELRRLVKRLSAKGFDVDLLVVDYGDIMKPEVAYNDKRHGLADIYQDLRAVASSFNCSVLTATQTNREGTRKAGKYVTDGTDVAEDYEKVRTADALITINQSDSDKSNDQVVLYFSEMRNAQSGIKLRFNQDPICMRFITTFEGYDT